jgi:transcriptional regulator of acetoin/glycerol metabolism
MEQTVKKPRIKRASKTYQKPLNATGTRVFLGQTFVEAKRTVLGDLEQKYFTALHMECLGNVSEMARRCDMERSRVRWYLRRVGLYTGEN